MKLHLVVLVGLLLMLGLAAGMFVIRARNEELAREHEVMQRQLAAARSEQLSQAEQLLSVTAQLIEHFADCPLEADLPHVRALPIENWLTDDEGQGLERAEVLTVLARVQAPDDPEKALRSVEAALELYRLWGESALPGERDFWRQFALAESIAGRILAGDAARLQEALRHFERGASYAARLLPVSSLSAEERLVLRDLHGRRRVLAAQLGEDSLAAASAVLLETLGE